MSDRTSDAEISIRRYRDSDEEAVRQIAFETGFFGASMGALVDDRRIFDRLLDPILKARRFSAFVVEREERIVGYAIASHRDVTLASSLVTISGFARDLLRLPALSARDRRYLRKRIANLLRAVRGPERRFRFPRGARLHINLLPVARGGGSGSRLMQQLLADLQTSGVRQVHANSYQRAGKGSHSFWLQNGFVEYSRVATRAWETFGIAEPVDLVCYVQRG
jgi:GNAT superfamily N-acetyltransferase